jgi:hypothetical protein
VKHVSPGREVTVIAPWCFSVTIEYVVESPSPVPRPGSFVVKNGSNSLCWIDDGIPGPSSTISTTTQSPS